MQPDHYPVTLWCKIQCATRLYRQSASTLPQHTKHIYASRSQCETCSSELHDYVLNRGNAKRILPAANYVSLTILGVHLLGKLQSLARNVSFGRTELLVVDCKTETAEGCIFPVCLSVWNRNRLRSRNICCQPYSLNEGNCGFLQYFFEPVRRLALQNAARELQRPKHMSPFFVYTKKVYTLHRTGEFIAALYSLVPDLVLRISAVEYNKL